MHFLGRLLAVKAVNEEVVRRDVGKEPINLHR